MLMSKIKNRLRRILADQRGHPHPPPHADGDSRVIRLEYPIPDLPPRWGWDRPVHPQIRALLKAGEEGYRELLNTFIQWREVYLSIRAEEKNALEPCWINSFMEGLDGIAIYGMTRHFRPKHIIEVGSGNSTLFFRKAIRDAELDTHITSVDPEPRADIDALCDRVIRRPMQSLTLDFFDQLDAGDFLFIDASHYVLANSDPVIAVLDILPMLKPGVIVSFHDIFWPTDYPANMQAYHFSEQYLLGAYLLGNPPYDILLPVAYITETPHLSGILSPILDAPQGNQISRHGSTFWMRKENTGS
ncbi:MAG: class I SAM-dependent methyltransferase [Candidatus Sumerlaeia bacterium]